MNNSEAFIVEEESPASEETADVKEEESTTISPDSVIPPTPETDGVAAHVLFALSWRIARQRVATHAR